jgi:competence protein ComEC
VRHIPNFWPGVLTGFSLGVAILTLPAGYPPWRWEVALVWSLIAACGVGFLRRYGAASTGCRTLLCLFLAGLAGYLYGAGRVAAVLNHQLPDCADETSRTFSFRIIDAPAWQHDELTGRNNARFVALVDGGWGDEACPVREDRLLRLGWYDAPPNLAAGQRWRGRGKLRPPWGYRNPGGFDYERWLLGRGLHGTGYLASGTLLEPGDSSSLLTDLRNALQAWLATQSLQQPALVRALMLGDDAAVSQDEWKLLRSSGTIHLLVVSGLHVGMVAGMTFLLARWALRPFPGLLLWCGAKRLASVFAIAGSGLYVLLSGSGVPALRAWLMSTAALLCVGLGRAVAPQRMMILIVFLMLAGNPLVVHQQGFWLSFAAVAALLWFYLPRLDGGQGTRQPGLARLGRWALSFLQAQLVLLVALAPLLALTQGEVPLHGPLINSLAVPLIAVLVLPLLLVAAALATWLPGPAGGLLSVADELLALLMQIIRTAASWPALPVSVAGQGLVADGPVGGVAVAGRRVSGLGRVQSDGPGCGPGQCHSH